MVPSKNLLPAFSCYHLTRFIFFLSFPFAIWVFLVLFSRSFSFHSFIAFEIRKMKMKSKTKAKKLCFVWIRTSDP